LARTDSYWQEYRRCNRDGCTRCPHGPYWFGEVDGKRVYFGAKDPRPKSAEEVDFPEGMDDVVRASIVLGVGLWQSEETARAICRRAIVAILERGPDCLPMMEHLARAWAVLARYQGWVTDPTKGDERERERQD